jgi:hypothetical protein
VRLFKRPSLQEEMKTDFLQLIEHLCQAESNIQTHLRSHDVAEIGVDEIAIADDASATTTTTESAMQVYEEESKTKTEDEIIHEALMQWRSCIFNQLDYLTTTLEEDKKEN